MAGRLARHLTAGGLVLPPFVPQPFAGETDIPRLVELNAACQAVDQLRQPQTLQNLREHLLEPMANWGREIVLWQTGSDLVAYSYLWLPPPAERQDVILWFAVHPSARASELPGAIVAWAEERAAALSGRDATLTISASEDNRWRLAIAAALGFRPIRYFLRMARRLDDALPSLPLPAGYQIRPLAGLDEVDAWVDLFNAAFADHWEHTDMTAEERRIAMARPNYHPDLDLVAVAPDGALAAFCSSEIRVLDDGTRKGLVDLVGTHPAHRRRGLAHAVLAAGLSALRAQEMIETRLSVDADSPTGAPSLYEELGFTVAETVTVFRRPIGKGGLL